MENPLNTNIYEIKIKNDIDKVHKLIIEGHKNSCNEKDKILGI